MTELYLIRHAQQFSALDHNGDVLLNRDDGLTEKGHWQARRLAERVAREIHPHALYASSLLRARQTAQPISTLIGLPVQIDPNLAELNLSAPIGASSAIEMDGWVRTWRNPHTPAFAGGEALADLKHRAVTAVEMIVQSYPGQKIVIVAHGGVMTVIFFHFLGIPFQPDVLSLVHITHTGIFHWRWTQLDDADLAGWELMTANDAHHLDDEDGSNKGNDESAL